MPSKTLTPATLTLCLSLSSTVSAEQPGNPFAVESLPAGYMVADAADLRGANKPNRNDAKVAAQPESAAPANEKKKSKNVDAKCGEVKCGSSTR